MTVLQATAFMYKEDSENSPIAYKHTNILQSTDRTVSLCLVCRLKVFYYYY